MDKEGYPKIGNKKRGRQVGTETGAIRSQLPFFSSRSFSAFRAAFRD